MLGLLVALPVLAGAEPSGPVPHLTYAFSARITLVPPVELGQVDGKRRRFIAVSGGTVTGARLHGSVLAGGGDWQAIGPDGRTEVSARYTLKTSDGVVIGVTNPGLRIASVEVTTQLTSGADVPVDAYYFRTAPIFDVADGAYGWMRRTLFVARGIRKPDHVVIDFYTVD